MSRPAARNALPLAVGLLVAAAMGSTLLSVRSSGDLISQMRGRAQRMEQVRALAASSGNPQERLQAFAASGKTLPGAVKAMLMNHMPGQEAQVEEAEPRPLGAGVVLRSTSLRFEDADLQQLAAFLERLETYDPPWKIVACSVLALPGKPGRASATLTVEAMEALPGPP